MLKVFIVVYGIYIYKYIKDFMFIEEVYGIFEDVIMILEVIKRFMECFIFEMFLYLSKEMLDYWFIDLERMFIFVGCLLFVEGVLVE